MRLLLFLFVSSILAVIQIRAEMTPYQGSHTTTPEKTRHHKRIHKHKTRIRIVTSSMVMDHCRKMHQHCRFSEDCCPGTYCYEHEGISHKRYCNIE
ncbi:hypothetical protein JTE90_020044 [Oedothorax gibbosus]|uniref:Uncharacterized protein n=1 Tax=Oedothorax gibbosus TaxID=931172 RepID=A0AAV6USI6_9ARAC|nr:hypothetical protein JTE90_020044 [Oedothorax gibbosus]